MTADACRAPDAAARRPVGLLAKAVALLGLIPTYALIGATAAAALVGGAQVSGIALGSGEGRLAHEPTHPLADAEGYVRYPDIDMASQMGQLIIAQRGYQANLAVVDRAKGAYEAAIQLGRNA